MTVFETVPIEQRADAGAPAITTSWLASQHHRIENNIATGSRWLRLEVTAVADVGTIGEIRFSTSAGAVSPAAKIKGLARGIGLGWLGIGAAAQTIGVEVRRTSGTGAVRLLASAATTTETGAIAAAGAGPWYPAGYEPPSAIDYPAGALIRIVALDSALAVEWAPSDLADSWNLELSTDQITWTTTQTPAAGITSTTLAGLINGVRYYLRISPVRFNENGTPSNVLSGIPGVSGSESAGFGVSPYGDLYSL